MEKPSTKMKVRQTPETPSELEQQSVETSHQAPEATVDEPPLVDHNVDMDQIDVDPITTNPRSPIKPASPIKRLKKKMMMLPSLGMVIQSQANPLSYQSITLRKKFPLLTKASGQPIY